MAEDDSEVAGCAACGFVGPAVVKELQTYRRMVGYTASESEFLLDLLVERGVLGQPVTERSYSGPNRRAEKRFVYHTPWEADDD